MRIRGDPWSLSVRLCLTDFSGEPLRDVSGHTGLTKSSLDRHRNSHLTGLLAQVRDAGIIAHGERVLDQDLKLARSAHDIRIRAEEAGDGRTALSAIREERQTVELVARLTGQIREQPALVQFIRQYVGIDLSLV